MLNQQHASITPSLRDRDQFKGSRGESLGMGIFWTLFCESSSWTSPSTCFAFVLSAGPCVAAYSSCSKADFSMSLIAADEARSGIGCQETSAATSKSKMCFRHCCAALLKPWTVLRDGISGLAELRIFDSARSLDRGPKLFTLLKSPAARRGKGLQGQHDRSSADYFSNQSRLTCGGRHQILFSRNHA